MRWICCIAFLAAVTGTAAADPDPHAEMAIALAAQAELQPPAAVLPVLGHANPHAQTAVTKLHGLARASVEASDRAADQAHLALPAATSLARQAQAASMAAAGQAQAAAAKDRASHPHPAPRR